MSRTCVPAALYTGGQPVLPSHAARGIASVQRCMYSGLGNFLSATGRKRPPSPSDGGRLPGHRSTFSSGCLLNKVYRNQSGT